MWIWNNMIWLYLNSLSGVICYLPHWNFMAYIIVFVICRADSKFAPSQWDTSLQTIWHCIQRLDYFDAIWCRRACSSLVQAMVWHQIGDKSLPEPMLAKIRNATWCYRFLRNICYYVTNAMYTINGCSAPRRMARIQSAHCVCSSKQSLCLLLCDERPVVAENTRQTWASGLDEGNCSGGIDELDTGTE